MKSKKFKLTVIGEENENSSDVSVNFDGTIAQLMDTLSVVLKMSEQRVTGHFGEKSVLAFRTAVAEYMCRGHKSDELLRDIVLIKAAENMIGEFKEAE